MARVAHVSVRARYRLLLLCTMAGFIYLFTPRSDRFAISAADVMQWSTELGKASSRLPPLLKEGGQHLWSGAQEPPPPPPEDPKKAKSKKKKTKKKGNGGEGEAGKEKKKISEKEKEKDGKGGGEQKGEEEVQVPPESLESEFFSWKGPDYVPRPKPPYKPPREPGEPVRDPFPLLSRSQEGEIGDVLRGPRINRPRRRHYAEATPLLIGFTRNWPQLLQCVVSYIAAGWPPGDIYVVENTGVMYSNRLGLLTLQNPFYLNHTQLGMLGVNVIITPTLLTFAQLQNFYAWTALERDWTEFFWSHQDLVVFSHENQTLSPDDASPYYSLYDRAVGVLQYLRQPGVPRWANHFFAYDHLTLVHRDAVLAVGGWDTHIPFYAADCDMYVRLMWAGYWQGETEAGIILDVATVLDDVGALLRVPGAHASFQGDPAVEERKERRRKKGRKSWKLKRQRILGALAGKRSGGGEEGDYDGDGDGDDDEEDERKRRRAVDKNGETWEHLLEVARRMEAAKYADGGGWRNQWQLRQSGGEGEPFARDPEGFETGLRMMIATGRSVFAEKWGHRGCDIAQMGVKAEDAWKLERDWDIETEGLGYEGDDW